MNAEKRSYERSSNDLEPCSVIGAATEKNLRSLDFCRSPFALDGADAFLKTPLQLSFPRFHAGSTELVEQGRYSCQEPALLAPALD